jgi:hypothetical protein
MDPARRPKALAHVRRGDGPAARRLERRGVGFRSMREGVGATTPKG